MSSINPSYLSPPNFFRIMAQKRDKRSLLSCAPPPHPPSSGGLSPLANAVTMWKLALLLYPYCYQTFPESNKKTPNQKPNKQKHREKFEYYLPYFGWSKSFATTVRSKLHSALSGSLSLSLSLSLLLFGSRAAQKGLQSSLLNEGQASTRDFSFLSLRAPDLIKGLCIR